MKKIEERVRMLTEQYGCADPMRLCELMGITVLQLELPDSVNGFTVTMEGHRFIVLNRSLDYYCRKITAAHELGHIILHGCTNTVRLSANTGFCINRYEREADCFAAHLLLAQESGGLEGLETVTSEDLSLLTHMPKSMIENAFFG